MCKCSFVRVAWLAAACLALSQAQQYNVDEPNGDVVFNRARSADIALIFDYSELVVNPGEQLNLDCGVRGESRYCIWETEGGDIYQVEDVYSNVFEGLSKPANTNGNECGIVVNAANMEHHGHWTCKVFVVGKSLVGKKNVIVTVKPTSPVLEIDNQRSLSVQTNAETSVKCSVAAARPAVTIRWFLGDRDVTVSAETEETPADRGGIYKSISTLRRSFEPSNNGKSLTCSINHKTLLMPENATVPLNVVFKPDEKPLSTFYQISPGNDYEVRFNFSANPQPIRQEWRFGKTFENPNMILPIPIADGRYTSGIEELGNGMYTAKLLIVSFMEEDADKEYMLIVENELGETQYKIKLSVDEAPPDGVTDSSNHDKIPPSELSVSEGIVFDDETKSKALSGGAVAGIVIVLLIIIVALCAAAYTRYRQMFCFASRAESKAHIQDPERNETDNGTANDAIKASTDQVNGKTESRVANGNGNLEQTQVDEVNNEKKNTDV